jgi:hypothetical protein
MRPQRCYHHYVTNILQFEVEIIYEQNMRTDLNSIVKVKDYNLKPPMLRFYSIVNN